MLKIPLSQTVHFNEERKIKSGGASFYGLVD